MLKLYGFLFKMQFDIIKILEIDLTIILYYVIYKYKQKQILRSKTDGKSNHWSWNSRAYCCYRSYRYVDEFWYERIFGSGVSKSESGQVLQRKLQQTKSSWIRWLHRMQWFLRYQCEESKTETKIETSDSNPPSRVESGAKIASEVPGNSGVFAI